MKSAHVLQMKDLLSLFNHCPPKKKHVKNTQEDQYDSIEDQYIFEGLPGPGELGANGLPTIPIIQFQASHCSGLRPVVWSMACSKTRPKISSWHGGTMRPLLVGPFSLRQNLLQKILIKLTKRNHGNNKCLLSRPRPFGAIQTKLPQCLGI